MVKFPFNYDAFSHAMLYVVGVSTLTAWGMIGYGYLTRQLGGFRINKSTATPLPRQNNVPSLTDFREQSAKKRAEDAAIDSLLAAEKMANNNNTSNSNSTSNSNNSLGGNKK